MQIRSRVKQLRLDRAAALGRTLSIREVSRETGIAVSTLRRIEENRAAGVDFGTLTRLAKFYEQKSIDALFEIFEERISHSAAMAGTLHGAMGGA